MRRLGEKGLTLVELVVVVAIMGMIFVGVTAFSSSILDVHVSSDEKSSIHREGLLAMERMSQGVRGCTHLAIPNSLKRTRDILAFSGTINEDDDYYFGDPLFPRIDEDVGGDMNADGMSGIAGIDDDGNGLTDEAPVPDDDESGGIDEDWLDGVNNDADENIDEDLRPDMNVDGKPGIAGMDDDGDGQVDENAAGQAGLGDRKDDDEDGLIDEDNLNETIYTFDSATSTLRVKDPSTGSTRDLSTRVTSFQVTYQAPERILIELTLADGEGGSIAFSEYVYPENTLQKIGKRVR
jgi:prepilin-type N-terminal cleavage/methylation domain-containing protein